MEICFFSAVCDICDIVEQKLNIETETFQRQEAQKSVNAIPTAWVQIWKGDSYMRLSVLARRDIMHYYTM